MPPRKTSGARNGSNLVDQDHMEMRNTPVTDKAIGCSL